MEKQKTYRRTMFKVMKGETVNLKDLNINPDGIESLWTVYDEDAMWENCRPDENGITAAKGELEHLMPSHHKGAFFEERIHDWDVDKETGELEYYGIAWNDDECIVLVISDDMERTDEND